MGGKTIKTWFAAGLIALATSSPLAAGIDIKGITPGMSEAAFKALYPEANCQGYATQATKDALRACQLKNFTIANVSTTFAYVQFFEDQLIKAKFPLVWKSQAVVSALGRKFGAPATRNTAGQKWAFPNGAALVLINNDVNGYMALQINTAKSRELDAAERAFRQRKIDDDL